VKGKAQAKNGDELFSEEKFHAATGKAQACTQGALHVFLFSWGVGGGASEEDFFSGFPWFPLCSLYILNKFSSCSQYVPQHVLHSTFISYALANVVFLSHI
jgi:hypothetical protein